MLMPPALPAEPRRHGPGQEPELGDAERPGRQRVQQDRAAAADYRDEQPVGHAGVVRDVFGASGEPEELAQHYGLTAPFIAQAARDAIARKKNPRKKH